MLIARSLAQQATVLLLDEPASQLDPAHRQRVTSLLVVSPTGAWPWCTRATTRRPRPRRPTPCTCCTGGGSPSRERRDGP